MAEEPAPRVPRDPERIHVYEKQELDYWTRELGVDVATLKATVNRVGPFVDRVRKALAA